MPSVCLNDFKDSLYWFKGYEHTYLDRDIRNLGRIGDIIPFRGLLRLASLRTGGILSISDLGRDARLKSAVVTSYLSIMELSCICYRMAPYLRNPASRLIKSPKFYMSDAGLACYLAELICYSFQFVMVRAFVCIEDTALLLGEIYDTPMWVGVAGSCFEFFLDICLWLQIFPKIVVSDVADCVDVRFAILYCYRID